MPRHFHVRRIGRCFLPVGPTGLPRVAVRFPVSIPNEDHRIRIDSDGALLVAMFAVLTGHVQLHQDQRTIAADRVRMMSKAGKVTVAGSLSSTVARALELSPAPTQCPRRAPSLTNPDPSECLPAAAPKGNVGEPKGIVHLDKVRYNELPRGQRGLMSRRNNIKSTPTPAGIATVGSSCDSRTVPIFYTPYLAFPLGDDRQSGLLFRASGIRANNGYQLDGLTTSSRAQLRREPRRPDTLSKRGVQLGGDPFPHRGIARPSSRRFLPNDAIRGSDRYYVHFNHHPPTSPRACASTRTSVPG